MQVELTVNATPCTIEADADMPLLWALREKLSLHGTKFGCGVAACGACTVHIDDEPVRSCSVAIGTLAGKRVTTIEGLSVPGTPHPVQQAWIEHQVPQCGYCQSGMIMAVSALLRNNPAPSDAEIDARLTNICRCGTYPRIRRAIHALVKA
jgi:isoquinoline 1-oxidoreductase alpha subunit